ncbi:hypothetical protein [Arthrobacter rhizosphaerae]|uniref:hypothetical protein n=1 Tax=Arthrobacter rhizosphaerae TaxID=2855490 RepID=UPI001FF21806|nr:hypothetical protein [Arthrobacter rhizosphaerae]
MIDRLERARYVTRTRDLADRRRVIVTPVPAPLMERIGPAYSRIAQRWNDYLETLSEDQITFATDFFAQAAEINRTEIDALRKMRAADHSPRKLPPDTPHP